MSPIRAADPSETGAAVLLVTHTNRLGSQDARNNYGLSGALRQVARNTMYALEDPDTKALLVGPDKSNLGEKGLAHRFIRTPVQHFDPTEHSDGTVALLDSIGDDERSVQDILVEQADWAAPVAKTEERALWVKDVIQQYDGTIPTTDLEEFGRIEHGYTTEQIRRAREQIGAKSKKEGGRWMVTLS